MSNNRQGFTLVEIMIAVMIIGLLASMAAPAVVRARDRARRTICLDNQRQIDSAVQVYMFEAGGTTPPDLSDLDEYFASKQTPTCAIQGATYSISPDKPYLSSCSLAEHASED